MSRVNFGDTEYAAKKKRTRRETFLGEMDQVVPWAPLLKLIEPLYPVAGQGRRRNLAWYIVARRRRLQGLPEGPHKEAVQRQERAKVEHPFLTVKRFFGYVKVRFRGRKKLMAMTGLVRPVNV